MRSERRAPLGLKIAAWTGVAFLNVPVLFIVLYTFTSEGTTYQFPPPGLTTRWFGVALARGDIWPAMWLSVKVGAVATGAAMIIGSMAAFALARGRFFGREAITLMLVLPIALPGIVTGIALLSAIRYIDSEPASGPSSRATPPFAW